MDKDRLDRQIEFIREIDKEKSIGRQTYLGDRQGEIHYPDDEVN